jgi:hypothetical protein
VIGNAVLIGRIATAASGDIVKVDAAAIVAEQRAGK